jgi:hypothetical protein
LESGPGEICARAEGTTKHAVASNSSENKNWDVEIFPGKHFFSVSGKKIDTSVLRLNRHDAPLPRIIGTQVHKP